MNQKNEIIEVAGGYAWGELNAKGLTSDYQGSRKNSPKKLERSHLPAAHENQLDAIDSTEPMMRVTWQRLPRQENPAHQHLISQESSDGARSKMYLLNKIARLFGAIDYEFLYWADLTAPTVNAIMAKLRDAGYKGSTRNAYLTVMKATAREAWVLHQLDLETYERIKLVKRVKFSKEPAGMSRKLEILKGIITTARNTGKPTATRNSLIMELMVFTGMRRKEVTKILVPDHILPDAQDILILGKGNKERKAKLPPQIWERLIDYLTTERTWQPGALFCPYWNKRKEPKISQKGMDVSSINKIYETTIEQYLVGREEDFPLGGKPITPHDIRRSFATIMESQGLSVRELQILLGHASSATTELYIRDDKDAYREKAASIGSSLLNE